MSFLHLSPKVPHGSEIALLRRLTGGYRFKGLDLTDGVPDELWNEIRDTVQDQFALIHGRNIPGSYAILLFIASDLASITSHIHNWVLFLLWLHPLILSGVISPLISSSILGTY